MTQPRPLAQPMGDNASKALCDYAERLERLEAEKDALLGDIADVFEEAKGAGFNPRALKQAVKERGMQDDKRQLQLAFEIDVDLYRKALGLSTNEEVLVEAARERINGKRVEGA